MVFLGAASTHFGQQSSSSFIRTAWDGVGQVESLNCLSFIGRILYCTRLFLLNHEERPSTNVFHRDQYAITSSMENAFFDVMHATSEAKQTLR